MVLRFLLLVCLSILVSCSGGEDDPVNTFVPVTITDGPFDQYAYEGQRAVFSVNVEGTEPISYQWVVDNQVVANTPQLELDAVKSGEARSIWVNVSNSLGDKNGSDGSSAKPVHLFVADAPDTGTVNGMKKIPTGGSVFSMGSTSPRASGDEFPVRNVGFTKSILMDSIPVDGKSFWELVIDSCPYTHVDTVSVKDERYPVTNVSWYDAVIYCNMRSRLEGLVPYYRYTTNIILTDSLYENTILQLEDSLLLRRENGVLTRTKVVIQDSIAIVPSKEDTVTFVSEGSAGFPLLTLRYTKPDTFRVIPNSGYLLTNVGYSVVSNLIEDTVFTKTEKLEYDTVSLDPALDSIGSVKVHKGVSVTLTEDNIANGYVVVPLNIYVVDSIFSTDIANIQNEFEGLQPGDTVLVIIDSIEQYIDTVIYDSGFVFLDSAIAYVDTFYTDSILPTEGYRLPTEAEWEFAVRQLTGTDFYFPNDSIDNYVWYRNSGVDASQPSGGKIPNLYGLYDMSGNVWEWCFDYYGDYKDLVGELVDPDGPDDGVYRVRRGGSFSDSEVYLRSSQRGSGRMESKSDRVGFRTVRFQF